MENPGSATVSSNYQDLINANGFFFQVNLQLQFFTRLIKNSEAIIMFPTQKYLKYQKSSVSTILCFYYPLFC